MNAENLNPELIKENMRVLEWGLYAPDGLLFGTFRYKEDAIACRRQGMIVSKVKIEPVAHLGCLEKVSSTWPVDMYITLLAVPDAGVE